MTLSTSETECMNVNLDGQEVVYIRTILCLDAKTGLLTGLLGGKQGWKCPVALIETCCGSKSLKVILIDSDFRAYPVLNLLVTLSLTLGVLFIMNQ